MHTNYVEDIRQEFRKLLDLNKTRGNGTIEMRGVSFVCDSPYIFGTPNEKYIKAEIEWYETSDRDVRTLYEIYGKTVAIWETVKDENHLVNSQYGDLIYSHENYKQYAETFFKLWDDPKSRQAVMYYTRPSIHKDAGKDHICTTSVQYFVNDNNYLETIVNMRSNDAIFGYANDIAWQKHVQSALAHQLSHAHAYIKPGPITWNVGSLHVYERHYDLIK